LNFTLAANYDADLVPRLRPFGVTEVYGKLPVDFAGGGRPSYMGTPLTMKGLASYVSALDQHDIRFNYLLNASCMGNREWGRRWQKKLMAFLDTLGTIGIRDLTVSTPFLLELVKRRRPEFRIKVGIYAQVDTPRRARFWEDLGADAINLESFSINRSFSLLRAIRDAVQCDLQLIANHCCLPNCAMQPYHQNGFAHSSDGSNRLFVDYCFLRCSRLRLSDPSLFIKAQWIRPEDLSFYEDMGFSTFKLIERGIPSEELLRRAKAYSERRYDGNLCDLLLSYGFKKAPRKARFWSVRNFFKPLQVNPLRLTKLRALVQHQGMLFAQASQPIHIDSSQIPADFIDHFETRDCARICCAECRYCEEIAARAVRIDPEFRDSSLRRYDELDGQLAGGDLWRI
jgi:collagenase-like PrtC family protease